MRLIFFEIVDKLDCFFDAQCVSFIETLIITELVYKLVADKSLNQILGIQLGDKNDC